MTLTVQTARRQDVTVDAKRVNVQVITSVTVPAKNQRYSIELE